MRTVRISVIVAIVLIGASFLTIALVGPWKTSEEPPRLAEFTLEQRPLTNRYLFDYAKILMHYEEGAHEYLRRIADRFHIEALVVSVPGLDSHNGIEELAVDMVNRWGIGRDYEGRGLLLLLVKERNQVKLEVGYELEDVFTDAFTGYIEDLQLKPYFLRSDIGTGLIAVMEEIERRAQIKHQGEYDPGMIAALDRELLAGGGGAKRDLARYRDDASVRPATYTDTHGAGARTPDEAWRVMLAQWAGEGEGIKADIYTEITKMAMGDPNRPDPRTKAALSHWRNANYQVRQDGDHAVIYFGNINGWNNAPFLFCNTSGGWKFDIVHQRRLVVMGPNPNWKVEQGRYPYVNLLTDAWQSTGKDLPLEAGDLYSCARDREIAERIMTLEQVYPQYPNDYSVVMELARLNVITGRRPNHVYPLLKKAKKLDPESAAPYKYSAIYNVNTFFQYKTALKEIQIYNSKRPGDVFGQNFLGFLYYRLGEYKKSIVALSKSVALRSDNAYAYSLMARDYALLYQHAKGLDPRKSGYKKTARAMLQEAETVATLDLRRIAALRAWLKKRNVL